MALLMISRGVGGHVCGYELPTDVQNFTQKDLTEVKIFQKVLEGLLFESPTWTFQRTHYWTSTIQDG